MKEHKQIHSHILGNFMLKVFDAMKDGWEFSEHKVYRIGRSYVADLHKSVADEGEGKQPEPEPEVTAELVIPKAESPTERLVPDWALLDALVDDGDKQGIEDYGMKFGVDLNKRFSPRNMLKQFKEKIGAI